MKDLGLARHILGIKISHLWNQRQLFLSQANYIDRVLDASTCDQLDLPWPHSRLAFHCLSKIVRHHVWRGKSWSRYGMHQHLAPCCMRWSRLATQPNITHVVEAIKKFMQNPGHLQWNVVKHVFRFMVGTKDYNILFYPNKNSSVVGYTDSDFNDQGWLSSSVGRLACTFWHSNSAQLSIASIRVVTLSKNLVHQDTFKNIDIRSHFVWDYVTTKHSAWRKFLQSPMWQMGWPNVFWLTDFNHYCTIWVLGDINPIELDTRMASDNWLQHFRNLAFGNWHSRLDFNTSSRSSFCFPTSADSATRWFVQHPFVNLYFV